MCGDVEILMRDVGTFVADEVEGAQCNLQGIESSATADEATLPALQVVVGVALLKKFKINLKR